MDKKPDIFDNDPDNMDLRKEAPLLHSISKENPFAVPQDYFDSLPSIVMEKCRVQTQNIASVQSVVSRTWSDSWKGFIFNWRMLTGVACAVVFCFFLFRTHEKPVSYETMAQNIPDSMIVAHLDNNITYITETTLEEYQPDINTSVTTSKSDTVSNKDEEIIAYLMDNNVNVGDIENNDKL